MLAFSSAAVTHSLMVHPFRSSTKPLRNTYPTTDDFDSMVNSCHTMRDGCSVSEKWRVYADTPNLNAPSSLTGPTTRSAR